MKTYQFSTIEQAEAYYEMEINTNSNNMNPEFESARDAWVSDNSDEIEECNDVSNKEDADMSGACGTLDR